MRVLSTLIMGGGGILVWKVYVHLDNAPLGPYARVHAHVMASFSVCP